MVKTFATVLEHKWLVTQDGKDVAVKKVDEPTYPVQLFVKANPSLYAREGITIFTAAGNPGDVGVHDTRKAVAVYEYKGMVTVANKTTLVKAPKPKAKKKPAKKGAKRKTIQEAEKVAGKKVWVDVRVKKGRK